jgi:hypothetical protein
VPCHKGMANEERGVRNERGGVSNKRGREHMRGVPHRLRDGAWGP